MTGRTIQTKNGYMIEDLIQLDMVRVAGPVLTVTLERRRAGRFYSQNAGASKNTTPVINHPRSNR